MPKSTKAASGLPTLIISPSAATSKSKLYLPEITRAFFGQNSNSHSIGVGDSQQSWGYSPRDQSNVIQNMQSTFGATG